MKRLVLLALSIVTISGHAETSYVLPGAVTYHMLGTREQDSVKFRNKWSKEGRLIGTPLVGVINTWPDDGQYVSRGFFLGQNSMGGAMGGVTGSSGIQVGLFRVGAMAGIYLQDASPFYRKEVSVNGLPLGKSLNLTALAGIEMSYGSAVRFNVAVTPALTLAFLSFSF